MFTKIQFTRALLCGMVLLSHLGIIGIAQGRLRFADYAVFLMPNLGSDSAGFDRMWPINLSPDGRFVAAIAVENELQAQQFTLLLWDLDEFISLSSNQAPAPAYYRLFELAYSDETSGTVGLQFSPDGNYLALKSPSYLQILSLPSLETIYQLADNAPTQIPNLAWSWDGQLLAVTHTDSLLVWDFQANETYSTILSSDYWNLTAFEDSWLATSRGREWQFLVCEAFLNECQLHETSATVLVPLISQSQVVTQVFDNGVPTSFVWQSSENSCCNFEPTRQLTALDELQAHIEGTGQNGDLIIAFTRTPLETIIFDVESGNTLISGFPAIQSENIYVSLDNYLVIAQDGLQLYQLESLDMLDNISISELELWESIPEEYYVPEAFRLDGAIRNNQLILLEVHGDFAVVVRAQ